MQAHLSFHRSEARRAAMAVNDRRYGVCGRGGRPMTAATAGAAGGAGRGRQGAVPTAGRSRFCHCEGRYGPWQSVPPSPVPFSNVFKWQFENTAILNSQFSIRPSGRQWRSIPMKGTGDRRCGGCGGRRGARTAGCRPYRRACCLLPRRSGAQRTSNARPYVRACCLLPVASSERSTEDEQCSPLRAGVSPVACCLLPVASSERSTEDEQCSPLQAGVSPVACCLLPRRSGAQRTSNARPYVRACPLLPVACCLVGAEHRGRAMLAPTGGRIP